MKLSLEMKKKDLIWVGLFVVLISVSIVYAWAGNDPAVMGHSSGEIRITHDLCKEITGHNCGYDDGAVRGDEVETGDCESFHAVSLDKQYTCPGERVIAGVKISSSYARLYSVRCCKLRIA